LTALDSVLNWRNSWFISHRAHFSCSFFNTYLIRKHFSYKLR